MLVKLLFVFPAKLDRKNDELDVRGSITDVFIGWVGNRIKINRVRNFKVQMHAVISLPHCSSFL